MFAVIAILAPLALLVITELGRTLLARLFGAQPDRYHLKLMRLPGTRGSTGFRLALILAGPVTGYLAVCGLAFAFHTCNGFPTEARNIVEATAPEHDASGKLHVDDAIVEVDGKAFSGGASELSKLVNAKRGAPVAVAVERGRSRTVVTIEPHQVGAERWVLGVTLGGRNVKDTGRALREAIGYPVAQTAVILADVIDLVKGKEVADPGGPVRIVEEFRSAFDPGPAHYLAIAMMFCVYALLALLVIDLVRALMLILFRS